MSALSAGLRSCITLRQSYTNDKEVSEVSPSDHPRGRKETRWLLGVPTAQSSQVKFRLRLCTKFCKSAHEQKKTRLTRVFSAVLPAGREPACPYCSVVQRVVCLCLDARCTNSHHHNCFLRHMRHLFSILHRSLRPRYRMLSSLPPLTYRMSTRPLDFYTGPLVWIDCEMTGLNPRKDRILEIAVGELPDFWQCIWPTISLPGSHNEWKPRACRWWNSIHHQNRKECPGWVCPL